MKKIYGYGYQDYVILREKLRLTENILDYDLIFISCFDKLVLIKKEDISVKEIEKYDYVGKILGVTLYVENIKED
jgi:hypothetical protein